MKKRIITEKNIIKVGNSTSSLNEKSFGLKSLILRFGLKSRRLDVRHLSAPFVSQKYKKIILEANASLVTKLGLFTYSAKNQYSASWSGTIWLYSDSTKLPNQISVSSQNIFLTSRIIKGTVQQCRSTTVPK